MLYRKFVAQLEARRRELGWSCEKVNEVAGLQSGYYQKLIRPDTPSGRVAQWRLLSWLMEAMYPKEQFDVQVLAIEDSTIAAREQQRGAYRAA